MNNNEIEVWDAVPRNILKDKYGDLFIVDVEIKRNSEQTMITLYVSRGRYAHAPSGCAAQLPIVGAGFGLFEVIQ